MLLKCHVADSCWWPGRSSPWVPGKFPHFEEALKMGVEMTAVDFAIRCLVQWSGSGLLNCKWSTQRFYDAFSQARWFLVLSYDIVWRFNQINVNLSSLREACSCFVGSSVFARAEFGNLAGWDLLVSLLQNQTKFWPFGSVWQRYNWLFYWMIRISNTDTSCEASSKCQFNGSCLHDVCQGLCEHRWCRLCFYRWCTAEAVCRCGVI